MIIFFFVFSLYDNEINFPTYLANPNRFKRRNSFERKRGRENKLEYPSKYTYQAPKKYVYLRL